MAQEIKNENVKVNSCDSRNRKVMKYFESFLVIGSYIIIAMALMSSFGFADTVDSKYDDIFSEVGDIFNYVQSKLLQLSGAGLVIAVAIGVFMRKFSMGKQDKIETGNKLIRDSLIGFTFLNSMPVVVKTIMGLTSGALAK